MPVKVGKRDNKWCVIDADGSVVKGGCHDTEKEAKDHATAINANTKEEKARWVPWGVTDFEELDAAEMAMEIADKSRELSWNYQDLIWNVLSASDEDVPDKAGAIRQLADDFVSRFESIQSSAETVKEQDMKALNDSENGIVNKVKHVMKKVAGLETEPKSLFIWKDKGGTNRFVARYSNNFRDDDRPPEIISEQSHKSFCALVDNGLVLPPELWIWHEKALKLGQSEWTAYDDSGFSLAGGYFLPGTEALVNVLKELDDVAMSHGMPKWSIHRDVEDKSIITTHITEEISLLPGWAAANKRTGFVILDDLVKNTKDEENMAISQEKREELRDKWNIPDDLLTALEAQNLSDAKEAIDSGVDRKEADTDEVDEVETEIEVEVEVETELEAETQTDEVDAAIEVRLEGVEELTGVLEETMKGVIALSERLKSVEAQVKELSKTDEEKISQKQKATPLASIVELMSLSVVGNDQTRVDGRTTLGKDAPTETPVEVEKRTGIPWIDTMLSDNGNSVQN